MDTVILTLHIIIAIFLIGVILLQRSEGGALGIGGGGGGGFMGGRSAASALTRTTVILAAIFFATSFGLGFFAESRHKAGNSIIDSVQKEQVTPKPTAPSGESPAQGKSPAQGESPAQKEEGKSSAPDATPEQPAPKKPDATDKSTPQEPQ